MRVFASQMAARFGRVRFRLRPASEPAAGDLLPTFEYLPSRDGLALLTGGPTQAGYAANAAANTGRAWAPRFSDQGQLAPKGHSNAPNGEYQFYADPEYAWSNGYTPFAIADGSLRIRARRVAGAGFAGGEIPNDPATGAAYEWVSGCLTSKHRFSQQGGYFEIEARLPKGTATWPAFWLLPTDERHPPELDVLEYLGHEPNSYRINAFSLGSGGNAGGSTVPAGVDLSLDFHRYGVLWTDTALTYSLDGQTVGTRDISGRPEWQQPFYLLVNLAIGSRLAQWVPPPDGATPSPADMLVRSVKAWQRTGPVDLRLSSVGLLDGAAAMVEAATLTAVLSGASSAPVYALDLDPAGVVQVVGASLRLRRTPALRAAQYHDVTVRVTDAAGRTYRKPVSLVVLHGAATGGDALAAGTAVDLTAAAWSKYGTVAAAGQADGLGGTTATRISETGGSETHGVEQLVTKPAAARRYLVYGDFKADGRGWVQLQVATADYAHTVKAFFNLATGAMGDRFASSGAMTLARADCVALGGGWWRCQVDMISNAGAGLRVGWNLVLSGADYASHAADAARGVLVRRMGLVDVAAVPAAPAVIPTNPTLDTAHPLAAGLVALYLPGVAATDYTGTGGALTRAPGAQDGSTGDGAALRSVQADSRAYTKTLPAAWRLQTGGTLYWRGALANTPELGASFLALNIDNNDEPPYVYYALDSDASRRLIFQYTSGGTFRGGSESGPIGVDVRSVATTFSVGGPVEVFANGALRSTGTWNGGPPDYALPISMDIAGSVKSGARTLNGDTNLVAIWNRPLTPAEIATLDADPYAMLRPAAPAGSASLTVGSGADALVLQVAQDYYLADAQYTVAVDGAQVGGTLAATARRSSGLSDTVTVRGDFAAGAHTVTLTLLEDAYGGSADTDRNLHLLGATLNGVAVPGVGAIASIAGTANAAAAGFTKPAPVGGGGGGGTTPATGTAITTETGDAITTENGEPLLLDGTTTTTPPVTTTPGTTSTLATESGDTLTTENGEALTLGETSAGSGSGSTGGGTTTPATAATLTTESGAFITNEGGTALTSE